MRLKQNASNKGGAQIDQAGRPGTMGQNIVLECSVHHISKVVQELRDNGVALANTSGLTQTATLRKALAYLGPRGLGTYEGAAAGYARLAARIQDLRDGGLAIHSLRENLIGPDGLSHSGVARYVLIGKRQTPAEKGGASC